MLLPLSLQRQRANQTRYIPRDERVEAHRERTAGTKAFWPVISVSDRVIGAKRYVFKQNGCRHVMHDAAHLRASCKVGDTVKLCDAVSLRRSICTRPWAPYLTCAMIKDSRLRGRASSEACDTVSRGRGTLNMFACMAMLQQPVQEVGLETCCRRACNTQHKGKYDPPRNSTLALSIRRPCGFCALVLGMDGN
jgi:hypothetical protein